MIKCFLSQLYCHDLIYVYLNPLQKPACEQLTLGQSDISPIDIAL